MSAAKSNTLRRLVRAYPVNTALIRLRQEGKVFDWAVGAGPDDDEASIRKHVGRWMPFAEFIGVAFRRPNRVLSNTETT